MRMKLLALSLICATATTGTLAAPAFVNGLALPGNMLDIKHGKAADSGLRVGYFSDIYFDPNRNEWWGLSDRGPGGGVLHYGTRVQRFSLDIDPVSGAISNFKILESIHFKNRVGDDLDGIFPSVVLDSTNLGNSFDPEGLVVHPASGNLLVSDEYGPSLYEFDRSGKLLRAFRTPENLKPTRADGSYNYDDDSVSGYPVAEKVATGRRTNRGFEGLAISPDGAYVYAMLQSAMVNEGGGDGSVNRIVKFNYADGKAEAQYAYQMKRSGQGQGTSALVAINDHEFLVLERNNRGVGVGATFDTADKEVYKIDLDGATDVTGIDLDDPAAVYTKVTKSARFLDLDANTIDLDGDGDVESAGKSPEKWEGLAIGPLLSGGNYLLLAGTDNDYSVTQNGAGTQFDVWFNFNDANPYASSIQCPMGSTSGCFLTSNNATPAPWTATYKLLPGVLHAYKVPAADLGIYAPPSP